MKVVSLRAALAGVCVAAVCLAIGPRPNAAQEQPARRGTLPEGYPQPASKPTTSPVLAHFAAKAPFEGDSGTPSRIDIMIERWSTDKELEDMHGALAKNGANALLPTLQGMIRRTGVVLIPGVQGAGARSRLRRPFNVYFARQIETPKGRQVVLGADHYLAFGQRTAEWPSDFEFSLVDIRLGPDGSGVGKVARAGNVVYNKAAKTIELGDYSKLPAQLTEVKSEPAGEARTNGAKQ
jgi:hypothetical protein